MATTQQTTPYDVARGFAEIIGNDADVTGLWVRESLDHVDLWLLTNPIPYDRRMQFRSLTRQLRERFPTVAVNLHIEHAGLYDVEPTEFRCDAPRSCRIPPSRRLVDRERSIARKVNVRQCSHSS